MKKIRVKTTVGETSVAVSPLQQSQDFVEAVGRALRRSARTARRIARMYLSLIHI